MRIPLTLLSFASLLAAVPATAANFTNATGFVTPSELTVPLRDLCLIKDDGSCSTIWSGSKDLVFKRDDANLTFLSLDSINIAPGRYFGVTAGYAHGWSVKLNGAKYQGKSNTITNGDQLWSVGTTAMTGGSVQTTTTASPTTLTGLDELGVGTTIGGNEYSTTVAWTRPICVTADATDSAGTCQTGDERVYPSSVDSTSGSVTVKSATLSVVMDLTHAVAVDSANSALALSSQYPFISFGDIGPVVHLASADNTVGTATGYAEMAFIFSTSGTLIGMQAKTSTPTLPGNTIYARGGSAMIETTAHPADAVIPSAIAQVFVGLFTASTGEVQFPITGETKARGLLTLDNVKQVVDSSVTFACDSSTTTLNGFTWTNDPGYTACSNMASGSFPYKIVRIVDSQNVLGTCTSGSAGYSSVTGACSSSSAPYASAADGYL